MRSAVSVITHTATADGMSKISHATTLTLDVKLLEKVAEAEKRLTNKGKYDLAKLKSSIEAGDTRSVLRLLNSNGKATHWTKMERDAAHVNKV